MKNNKKITIDDLARMVQKGFEESHKENQNSFNKIDARLDNLESGVEEVKLKLDNVAYRFELNAIDNRLKKVETKLGIKYN